jgi:hypothetical protein
MSLDERKRWLLRCAVPNLALFTGSWFVCVLTGAYGVPWLGLATVAAVIWIHLRAAPLPRREALLIAIATALGAFWDGQISGYGWVVYTGGTPARWLAPVWTMGLWAIFATLLNVSLRWLHGRYGLALVIGGLSAPFAYAVGAGLGAATFPDKLVAMLAVAAGWAVILPLLVALSMRLDGFAPRHAPPSAPAATGQRSGGHRV